MISGQFQIESMTTAGAQAASFPSVTGITLTTSVKSSRSVSLYKVDKIYLRILVKA